MGPFKISVLITYYNQEQYVDECLASVFNQVTDFDFKIIVGDDGSTDNTIYKVKEWEKKYPGRISLITQPRVVNKKYIGGSRASRNRIALMKQIDTPYFIFLDGDDYWTDVNKLQIQYDTLEKKENFDCVACAHQIRMFHENDPSKVFYFPDNNFKEKYKVSKWGLKQYWKNLYFHTDTLLFRSDYNNKLNYDLLDEMFNDNIIAFAFLQFGKFIFLPLLMTDYRQNNNGIWAGETSMVSVVRNFMDYDIELKINKSIKKIITQRHLENFEVFLKNPDSFKNIPSDYLCIAEKYKLPVTTNILKNQLLFSDSINKDRKKVKLLKYRFDFIKNLKNKIKKLMGKYDRREN